MDANPPSPPRGRAASEPAFRPPSPHPAEAARLESVREFAPFAYPDDRTMRLIAQEAMDACDASAAMVSILEEDGERFIAGVGECLRVVRRPESLCAHAILEPDALVVEDLARDPRFRTMPYVLGPPFLRFYAGAPILDATGLPLGAVCVTHTKPHEVSSRCLLAVARLAEVASAVLESRLLLADSRVRYAPLVERQAALARMDALLYTMLQPRPACA